MNNFKYILLRRNHRNKKGFYFSGALIFDDELIGAFSFPNMDEYHWIGYLRDEVREKVKELYSKSGFFEEKEFKKAYPILVKTLNKVCQIEVSALRIIGAENREEAKKELMETYCYKEDIKDELSKEDVEFMSDLNLYADVITDDSYYYAKVLLSYHKRLLELGEVG